MNETDSRLEEAGQSTVDQVRGCLCLLCVFVSIFVHVCVSVCVFLFFDTFSCINLQLTRSVEPVCVLCVVCVCVSARSLCYVCL